MIPRRGSLVGAQSAAHSSKCRAAAGTSPPRSASTPCASRTIGSVGRALGGIDERGARFVDPAGALERVREVHERGRQSAGPRRAAAERAHRVFEAPLREAR